jgi:CBS domain-containing protein
VSEATVREAMVPDPRVLQGTATAQEAAGLLVRPEVLAVLVVDGERLLGCVTAAGLVERVVAAGRDPRTTPVADVAEQIELTIGPDEPLDDAYHLLEERDIERLPVTDGGRLLGVLSRSSLQRRLAEDEPPTDELDVLEV